MSDDRVLQVLSIENDSLLVYGDRGVIEVRNGVSENVTPGDYVNVVERIQSEKAVNIARRDDPNGIQGLVAKVTNENILVKTDSKPRILPKPSQNVSEGDSVLLTDLGEVYKVFEDNIVDIEKNSLQSPQKEVNETSPSDLAPDDVPNRDYEDFGGLDKVVEEVKYKLEVPLKEPERFSSVGIEAPKGVLFYGPPGTGKTYLAKIVASRVDEGSFYSIRGPELSHELVGGTERKLRELFDRAKENPPAIVFFDEIDSMAPRRDKVMDTGRRTVGQLLSLIDGLEDRGQVVVVGTTNLIEAIDPALRRPGRFGREIEFPRPSKRGREEILEIHRPDIEFGDGVSLEMVAENTNGWTGAHVKALFEEIGEILLREERDMEDNLKIRRLDVERAVERVQAQINNKEAQRRRENEDEGREE